MLTINQLQKNTNSLQSMIIMNSSEMNLPAVGMFLTQFFYTDRRSEEIVSVDGNKFTVKNGTNYYTSKRGIHYIDWEGKKRLDKNARITKHDHTYTDLSF